MLFIQFHHSIKNSISTNKILIHNYQRSKFSTKQTIFLMLPFLFNYFNHYTVTFCPCSIFIFLVSLIVFLRRRRRHSVKSKIRYRRCRLVIKERYSGSRFKGRRDCGMAKKKGANV